MANKTLRQENDQFLHSDLVAFSGNVGFGYDTAITSEIPSSTIPLAITVVGTDAISLPAGTEAQRPTPFGIPSRPMFRYNIESQAFEVYYPSIAEWRSLGKGIEGVDGDFDVQGDITTTNLEYTTQSSTPITTTSDNFWTFHEYYGLNSNYARGYSHHTNTDPSIPGGSSSLPHSRVCGYSTTEYSGSRHSGAYLLVSHEQGTTTHNFSLEVTGIDEASVYNYYTFKLGCRSTPPNQVIHYGTPTVPSIANMLLKINLSSALAGVLKGDIIDIWDDASNILTSTAPRWTHRFISDADTDGDELTVDSWYAVQKAASPSTQYFNPNFGQKIRHIRPGVGEISHVPEVSATSCNNASDSTSLANMFYTSSSGIWCNLYNYRRAFHFQYFGRGAQVTPTPIISGGPVL